MKKIFIGSAYLLFFRMALVTAWALNPALPPGSNFDLSNWYLQLPTSNNILTGTGGTVDSLSTTQLVAGATNAYFYTAGDGAMTFWVPDDGAMTSNSSHPRSELREEIVPGNTDTNWAAYGTHILTATCVVSNVPSDTEKVCIGQMHEPNNHPDGSAGANTEHMIMFDLASQKIYSNVSPDGNVADTFSTTFVSGSNVKLGKTINYTMSIVDGVLTIIVNSVTNSWGLFSGSNYSGLTFQNWDTASSNTLYFKAGDYNQTTNQCNCPTDGARVAFYSLTHYNAPHITNQPVSTAVSAGSTAAFSTAASDWTGMTYQWWLNATNRLTAGTNASLTLTNVSLTNMGNYTVVVNDGYGSVTSSVALLTVNKQTPKLTAPTAAPIAYGQTLASATLSGGTATNTANNAAVAGTFAFTTPTTTPGVGTAAQNVTFTPTDTADFNPATTNVNVTVVKQTPTLTSPTATALIYGQTLASSTLSGGAATNAANKAVVAGNFTFTSPTTAPGVGTAAQSVTFTPTDTTNYNTAITNVSVTVGKQTPTLTAPTATALTYGQTLAGSTLSGGAATNAANKAVVAGNFTFTSPTTAPSVGTAAQNVTFTPTDTTNYNTAITTVSVTVGVQTPTLTAPAASGITYGQTLASSTLSGGTATNAANNAVVAGNFTFTSPTTAPGAGTAAQSVTFTPTDTTNYITASTTASVTVGRQTPTLTAPTATGLTYGQTLASSTLTGGGATNTANNATVTGTFTFTTPTNTPGAGTAAQSVNFTPTDTTNYNTAITSASVTVSKQTPILTAPMATGITYGQALASSTLSGGTATNTANNTAVAGTFAFTTPTAVPVIGTAPQSVTFTPADTTDYNTAVTTANVTAFANHTILDARWLDGTRTNTSLPTDSAWFANSAPSLTAATNSLTGVPDPASTMTWWTYFTTNAANPLQLGVSDTLRITLAFTSSGVNTSNSSSSDLRIGLYNSSNGIRTLADGTNPQGSNYLGYLINLNFGQVFGGGTTMQYWERTNLASPNLMTTIADYNNGSNLISSSGAPAKGSAAFSNGVPYTLQLLVQRNPNSLNLTTTFSSTNNWTASLAGSWTDTNNLTSAFDTFVFRSATNAATCTNFTFTEFKVELMSTNNQPPVAANVTYSRTEGDPLTIAIADLLTNVADADGDAVNLVGVGTDGYNLATAGGFTLATNNTSIFYTNSATANVGDSFNYTVADSYGGIGIGTVTIMVESGPTVATNSSLTVSGGVAVATFYGYPGDNYYVQLSTNLTDWVTVGTNTAPPAGVFQFTNDVSGMVPEPATVFFRLVVP